LLSALVLAAALLPAVSAASASAAPGVAAPPIAWHPCPAVPTVDCGSVRVPLDWARPHGPQISVGVARHAATDPAHRVGSLFVNPGGPGGSGTQIAEFADLVFSAQLNSRFDIVGVDPRGVGDSTPVSCGAELNPPGYTLFPRTEQQFRQMLAHNRVVGASCLAGTGSLLGHVDAVSTARDMEVVRRALRSPTMTFLGLSYGTQLGANYAQLYPRRVRAMVFDGALEHSLSEVPMLTDEISAAEDSFDRFAVWCHDTAACVLHGEDVGRVYDDLVAAADRNPIPVPGATRPVSGADIRLGTQDKLLFKEPVVFGAGWADLAVAIAQARAGDAHAFASPPVTGPTDFRYPALAIGCMDYVSEIRTWPQLQQRIEFAKQLAPHLQGAVQTWTLARCIGWPVPAANPPRRLDVRGVPPILIVNATHDPSTPYQWALGVASQVRGSVLLTRVGDGHTSYFSSPCAQSAIDEYLITGRIAGPVKTCVG
jgi:pimeloyl-ACP methyl ester carboxylesterase